jgi:hypothetical protein
MQHDTVTLAATLSTTVKGKPLVTCIGALHSAWSSAPMLGSPKCALIKYSLLPLNCLIVHTIAFLLMQTHIQVEVVVSAGAESHAALYFDAHWQFEALRKVSDCRVHRADVHAQRCVICVQHCTLADSGSAAHTLIRLRVPTTRHVY